MTSNTAPNAAGDSAKTLPVKHTAWALTLAGLLPFAIAAVATNMGYALQTPARLYGAVIMAFLSGLHWAVFLFFAEKCPRPLLLTSNITALLAWLSLLLPNASLAIWLQAVGLSYLLLLDWRLWQAGIWPTWFWHIRATASGLVLICLTAML